ncbi:putative AT DNA binding protein [Aspergillus candidus]|uniref:AT DNA binding protein n=1 Tax=Aspergillus candidus TaxID=41067 RepID=A0A2I2FCV2_ASPCN|nr:hypothetical protein BDW47DRAFT_104875 [Aspergillus candidus]PLB38458.1 hypothetical protein BDW47DRAFT_104875 [Aspergillus candidus]
MIEATGKANELADDYARSTVHPEPISEPRWSPLNFGADADGDDDSDDGGLPTGLEMPDSFGANHLEEEHEPLPRDRSSPRVTFEQSFNTPNVDHIDQGYMHNDGNFNSTPSKMPSPSRESHRASENTFDAGHTPGPPRLYPVLSSSPSADEERRESPETAVDTAKESEHNTSPGEAHPSNPTDKTDPTDEHRDFDSIIESEGFSMVSLDTLPSAKNHISAESKMLKGALKPFFERESNGVLRQKSAETTKETNADAFATNMQHDLRPMDEQPAYLSLPATENDISPDPQSPEDAPEYPAPSPARDSPVQPSYTLKERRPLVRLARMIRAGIALGNTLRHTAGRKSSRKARMSLRDQDLELEASRRRLELVFNDLHPDSQEELQAGLNFGQELVKLRRQVEYRADAQLDAVKSRRSKSTEKAVAHNSGATPQRADAAYQYHISPSPEMKRRMAEWQREREAISREIELANSSQVIVLDSDYPAPTSPNGDVEDAYTWNDQEQEYDVEKTPRSDAGPELRQQPNFQDDYEEDDDGSEDIWQQEAQDHSMEAGRSSPMPGDAADDMRPEPESSPQRAGSTADSPAMFSRSHWANEREKLPNLGPSRVRQLREQEVDVSALLRVENTPNRSRYYYGKSSPVTSTRGPSSAQSRNTATPHWARDDVNDYLPEQGNQSDGYFVSSPQRSSDDEAFQIDPTTRHEQSLQYANLQGDEDGNSSISGAAVPEGRSPHETSNVHSTPSRPIERDNQASTWFQKISSLTPGWLKAPVRKSFAHPESPLAGEVIDEGDEDEDEVSEANPSSHDELDDEEVDDEEDVEPVDTPKPIPQTKRSPPSRRSLSRRRSSQVIEEPQPIASKETTPKPIRPTTRSPPSRQSLSRRRSSQVIEEPQPVTTKEISGEAYERQLPLSVSGYFSNDHYNFLRRLYRLAKQHPERFPYFSAPGRPDIIGDWIWTSSGAHGVPVTERQFAVIDRFVQELAKADLQAGGTGQIGWSEAELHRRLISVIIGEQIRGDTTIGI